MRFAILDNSNPQEPDYQFTFVCGSCGHFVKSIFYHYLYELKYHRKRINFVIDPVAGHCHNTNAPRHHHWIDQIDQSKKIIAIDFDDDDKSIIAKMCFHKIIKSNINENPNILTQNWGGSLSHINPSDHNLLEKMFMQNPDYLIFPNWKEQIKKLNPVLIIKFKDILHGNLNDIIANFLQTVPLLKVENYINEYRILNKKYLDNTSESM